MFYVMGVEEDGRVNGDVCGPYDTPTEAAEMALSGQMPVVPLPWLLDLIDGLTKLADDHAREHQQHDCRLYFYHRGRNEILHDLVDHMDRVA